MRPAPASASAALQSPAPIEYAPIEAIPAEDDATAQISRALTDFDTERFIERLDASMRAIIAPSVSLADEVDRFAVVAPPPPADDADDAADADAFDDADAFALDDHAAASSRSAARSASAVPPAPVLVDEARLAACIAAQNALDAASAAAFAALRAEAERSRARVADLLESAQRRECAAAAKQSFQTRFVEEESQFKQQACCCQ